MAGTDSPDLTSNGGVKSWGRGGAMSWRMSSTGATADTMEGQGEPPMDGERHNPELWDGRKKHRRTHLSPDGISLCDPLSKILPILNGLSASILLLLFCCFSSASYSGGDRQGLVDGEGRAASRDNQNGVSNISTRRHMRA